MRQNNHTEQRHEQNSLSGLESASGLMATRPLPVNRAVSKELRECRQSVCPAKKAIFKTPRRSYKARHDR
jgi:hypothetical protein